MTNKTHKPIIMLGLVFWLLLIATSSCSDTPPAGGKSADAAPAIRTVSDIEHFKKILQENGGRLLVFDFYADWCRPCKQLSPILEELALKSGEGAAFYKIDVDRSKDLAAAANLRGIPYVLFVKDGRTVHAMTGLHPKSAYERVIARFAEVSSGGNGGDRPDGEIVDGVHVIRPSTAAAPYSELNAEQARELIRSANPLILDVRTPGEFYDGHLKGAKLIPVQQLEARMDEMAAYRDKEVFIYCRSGNRSTVAAEILMRGGFGKLYNLRRGIIEWWQKGYGTVK